jgi:ribosomal protein S18 acetylase RimI-like enzyme
MLVRLHADFDPLRFLPETKETAREYGAFLGTQLARSDSIVLVAEQDGEVRGYTFATIEGFDYMTLRGPAGILNDILIDPAYRGHGIGQLLLDATIAAIKARGVPRVVLWVASANERAQALFARAGFRPTMLEMTCELTESRFTTRAAPRDV